MNKGIKPGKWTPEGVRPLDDLEFKTLHDDDGRVFLESKEFDTGEMKYHICIEVNGDNEGDVRVCLMVVKAFESLPERIKKDLRDSMEEGFNDWNSFDITFHASAPVGTWSYTFDEEDDWDEKVKEYTAEAKEEAKQVKMLLGFYLDAPINMLGSTGWDFLDGDVTAGLKRLEER